MRIVYMETLRRFARTLALLLASGYILFFYSERFFFAAFRPGDTLLDYAFTWGAYTAAGVLFLATVAGLRVRGWGPLLIAGGLFGWLIEGTWAQTLYGTEPSAPFPVSIVITAIQWHALLTVLVGWYAVPRVLRRDDWRLTLALAAGIGLAWGAWAPFQWGETPPVVMGVAGFFAYSGATFGLCVVAYWLLDALRLAELRLPRALVVGAAALHLLIFIVAAVLPLGLRPLLILPPLLAIGLGLLWWGRGEEGGVLEEGHVPVAARQVALLLTVPLFATAAYAGALALGDQWPPLHQLLWLGAALAGTALWLWAAARIVRGRTTTAGTQKRQEIATDHNG